MLLFCAAAGMWVGVAWPGTGIGSGAGTATGTVTGTGTGSGAGTATGTATGSGAGTVAKIVADASVGISELVVFGDSYEDDGALLQLTRQAVEAKIPEATLLPGPPEQQTYWNGRWSNGPTLVEVLARTLHVPLVDYAMGGAKSGAGNYYAWLDYVADSGVAGQITSYLHDNRLDPKALYIVSASTNDFSQFHDFHQPGRLPVGAGTAVTYEALAEAAALNVRTAVLRLVAMGARRIIVFSSYPVGESPLAIATDPQVAEAKRFTGRFDATLCKQLKRLRTASTQISIFPLAETMRAVMRNPSSYGMTNTTEACQPTAPTPGPVCASAESYVWWDELHPTAHMHAILGHELAALVGVDPKSRSLCP